MLVALKAVRLIENGSMQPPATGLVKYAKLPNPKPPSHRHGELKSWLQVKELQTNRGSMAVSGYNSITTQNWKR